MSFVKCPHCLGFVRTDALAGHLRRAYAEQLRQQQVANREFVKYWTREAEAKTTPEPSLLPAQALDQEPDSTSNL